MLTRSQFDRQRAAQALKSETPTPGHAAAEGAVRADAEGLDDVREAERRRDRIRHLADPGAEPAEIPEVAHADLPKAFDQAVDVPEGYPPLRPVHAEQFRRPLVSASHAASSPGYQAPGRPVPVPSATLTAGMITRPLLADGRYRPCAPEAC